MTEKDNIVFIGSKPFMNYVGAITIQFQKIKQEEVIVSARGKFTGKAIDVVEIVRKNFLKDEKIHIDDVKISSQEFKNSDQKTIFVSTIDIKLVKGDK